MILDALQRKRRQDANNNELMPSVDTEHQVPRLSPAGVQVPLWLIAILVVLLLALGVWVFWSSRSVAPVPLVSSESASRPPAVLPQSTSPSSSIQPALSAGTAQGQAPGLDRNARDPGADNANTPEVIPKAIAPVLPTPDSSERTGNSSAIAALYREEGSIEAGETVASTAGRVVDTPDEELTGRDVAQVAGDTSPPSGETEESPIDLEAILRKAQGELGRPTLAPHPVPLLEDLSQQQKDKIPSVLYTLHDYRSDGTSSLVINGQTVAEGQRVKGFLVKEILTDSAILNWGGVDFRLRSLNSWVNL
ncbi:conserved hypothetical protein [Luminiphilus syltensis NOR5-1B]|uniref:Type II secretion system protein GspB C-terminal domain-containing protein n=1 Tax=Luminiphilus syltensis NOR5-1B TaxID=565045 RepID=B8KSE3_9GAMM|nr:general secretion pathway protein GspB [Luminiphilus syltensis]EED34860.1 conserved hypothetical protein [Luminiphilus syltensis NOR5-1B]